MTGRHPFSELTKDFTPERRRRIDAMKQDLLDEMPLRSVGLDIQSTSVSATWNRSRGTGLTPGRDLRDKWGTYK